MKSELAVGITETLKITVTAGMFATFDSEVVHEAYSTASMVKHMEQVSRQLILPYIESTEESAGAKVAMTHIAPTPLGSTVECTATLTEIDARKVSTAVEVKNALGLIGKGTVTIAILPNGYMKQQLENIQNALNTEG